MATSTAAAGQNNLQPRTQVFIGNLTPAITGPQLVTACEAVVGVGKIKKLILPPTNNSKKFAFVHLKNEEDADLIISALNGRFMNDTKLNVSLARSKASTTRNSIPQLLPHRQEIQAVKIRKSGPGTTALEKLKDDTRSGAFEAGEAFVITGQENQSTLAVANVESVQDYQSLNPLTIEHVLSNVLSYLCGQTLMKVRLVSKHFNREAVNQLRRRRILKLDLSRDLVTGHWRKPEIPKANLTETMNLSPFPFAGFHLFWQYGYFSSDINGGTLVKRLNMLLGDFDKFFDACQNITEIVWEYSKHFSPYYELDQAMTQCDLASFLLNPKRYPNLVKLEIQGLPDNSSLTATAGSSLNTWSVDDQFLKLKHLEIHDNNRHNFSCDQKYNPESYPESYFRSEDIRCIWPNNVPNPFVRFGTEFLVYLMKLAPNLESLTFKKKILPEDGEELMATLRIVQLPFLSALHLGFDLYERDLLALIQFEFHLRKCTLAWLTPLIKKETLERFIKQQSSSLVELTIGDGFIGNVDNPEEGVYADIERIAHRYCGEDNNDKDDDEDEEERISLDFPTMPNLASLEFKRLATGIGYTYELGPNAFSPTRLPNLQKLRVRTKYFDPGDEWSPIDSFFPEHGDDPNNSVRQVSLERMGPEFTPHYFGIVSKRFPQMRKLTLTFVLPAILTALWSTNLALEELCIDRLVLPANSAMNSEDDVDVDSVLTGLSPEVCKVLRHELRTHKDSKWTGILDNFKRQPSLCSLENLRCVSLTRIGQEHDHHISKTRWTPEIDANTDMTLEEPQPSWLGQEDHGVYKCVTSAISDLTGYSVFMQMTQLTSLFIDNSHITSDCVEVLRDKLQLLYKLDISLEQKRSCDWF